MGIMYFNSDFNACACVWLFYLLRNGPFRELRRPPEDDTYDVSKHVGDLLTFDVNILVHVIFYHGAAAPVGQGLRIFEDSQSHSDTSHSVGLLWTSNQPDAEIST